MLRSRGPYLVDRADAPEIVHLPEGTAQSLSSVQANHFPVYATMPG